MVLRPVVGVIRACFRVSLPPGCVAPVEATGRDPGYFAWATSSPPARNSYRLSAGSSRTTTSPVGDRLSISFLTSLQSVTSAAASTRSGGAARVSLHHAARSEDGVRFGS